MKYDFFLSIAVNLPDQRKSAHGQSVRQTVRQTDRQRGVLKRTVGFVMCVLCGAMSWCNVQANLEGKSKI